VLEEDNVMLHAIRTAAPAHAEPVLHIFDARPYLNAGANALKGKGYESITALGGAGVASLIFCGIENIHAMRGCAA
jgi:hypothetical protein